MLKHNQQPKIIYAGSDPFACGPLEELVQVGLKPTVVVSNPDQKAGRGRKILPNPVKQTAQKLGIDVWTPESIKDDASFTTFQSFKADIFICVAYGKIIPKAWLNSLYCLNIHPSLLPKWRGCSPIEHALLYGDKVTGVSVIQMSPEIDAGAILYQEQYSIKPEENTQSLGTYLFSKGTELLIQAIKNWQQDKLPAVLEQNKAEVSYAPKIKKEEAHIDWHQSAENIFNMIRAYYRWPVAYTFLNENRIKVFAACVADDEGDAVVKPGTIIQVKQDCVLIQCGQGILSLQEIVLPGKRRMPISEYLKANNSIFIEGLCFE